MRHLVWLATFVAVATMPLFASFAPIAKVETTLATAQTLAPAVPLSPFPRTSSEDLKQRIAPSAFTSAEPTLEAYAVDTNTYVADLRAEPLRLLPLVYGFGVVFLLSRYAVAFARLRRTIRHSECGEVLPNGIQVRMAAPGLLASPATFGWPHATVLMPAESKGWPEERRRAAIEHELAHVERLDWVWQCLALVVCTAQWFNPLAWFAAARLRAEAEGAADDAVLRRGLAASSYAQELLEVAKGIHRDTPLAVPIARPGGVAHRVRAILARDLDRSAARRPAHLAAGTGTLFAAAILGGLGLSAAAATQGPFQVARQSLEDWNMAWDEDRAQRGRLRFGHGPGPNPL
jgi:beta-lactamase regulating signal transducer with metallopeptidase domain